MSKHRWTSQDDRTLFEMRAADRSWAEIATALNRSINSCCSYYRDARRRFDRPKLPPQPRKVIVRVPDCVEASNQLQARMNEAFHRFANANRISRDDARLLLMGDKPKPVPGTEVFFKTSAVRRLAA